ncbi:MAG: UbiD family decarboxylase [Methanobacteriota archaeon]|nr:MAG: UbiD family decarboxylase [Euryarchaeota archaeon]
MSLKAYIEAFPEIEVIDEEVNREYEITKMLKEDPTKPILFNDLNGFKAIGNLWGTRERMAKGLGCKEEEMVSRILEAMRNPIPPKIVDDSPLMKNKLDEFDLRESPIPKWFPGDGGHYITSGIVVAELDGKRNLSFHRCMVIGENRLVARVVPRHLFAMHKTAKERGEELEIAIVIGVCPHILIPAGMSVGYDTDELEIASALRKITVGEEVDAIEIESGLTVPAWAEYCFEGRITHETAEEGPFADITGTYDIVREEPVIEIDRIYHTDDPVFHALLPGGYEHYYFMGMPREPVIYEAVSKAVAKVKVVRLTEGGCCWLHGVVSIEKHKEGDAKNAILAAFGAHPSMKMVTIVDDDIDVYDDRQVEWAVSTRFQAHKDVVMIEGTKGSSVDPSNEGLSTKMGLDATKPLGKEGFDRATLD